MAIFLRLAEELRLSLTSHSPGEKHVPRGTLLIEFLAACTTLASS